ncbi:MAG: histone deacetylase [Bacillota bacterium]|nr:histone deacetylase [Bacillota bacterium]
MTNKNSLGLVFFPAFDWAISPDHPEREERLLYTMDQLMEEGIEDIDSIKMYKADIATEKDIERVHFCVPDVKSRLTKSHLVSIGGVTKAFDLYFSKEVSKAFALVRPPGHHAHKIVYGDRGFCIANIEAVALEKMRTKYKDLRVAIVDTDCHHGDGTEDIYYNDKDTLFISIHQDGRTLFPGTGSIDQLGGPGAFGYNINIPLPPKTGDQGFLYALENVIMPILEDFKPDLIINSAGQDNHYSDPLTSMNFSAQGYARLNEILKPDLAILEGGYSIQGALPYVNLGIILAMAGLDYGNIKEPDFSPDKVGQSPQVTAYIKDLCNQVMYRWKNKEALAKEAFSQAQVVRKDKQIYYDTDGILENQKRYFHICPRCSGLDIIESENDRLTFVKAITLPRDACPSCEAKAYADFDKSKGHFNFVYLQDKKNDKYLSK